MSVHVLAVRSNTDLFSGRDWLAFGGLVVFPLVLLEAHVGRNGEARLDVLHQLLVVLEGGGGGGGGG